MDDFERRNREMIQTMGAEGELRDLTRGWFAAVSRFEYSYHFKWLGRPIIQFPQDIIALQEVIWEVRPRTIIETGIARGGSLIFSASMLELIGGPGFVVGIDVDIRAHNREAVQAHPMNKRIRMIEGSSTSPDVVAQVGRLASGNSPVVVILDSNHTHEHVLEELKLYAPMVTAGSYLVVLDTVVEDMPASFSGNRPWGPGNNPRTAVREFLGTTDRFVVDSAIDNKLLISVGPGGYLKCVKDA
jgi:cephalosporin hydroxylase